MTELLGHAFQVARVLTSAEQDVVAHALLRMMAEAAPVQLTSEERDAISRSKAAAARR